MSAMLAFEVDAFIPEPAPVMIAVLPATVNEAALLRSAAIEVSVDVKEHFVYLGE